MGNFVYLKCTLLDSTVPLFQDATLRRKKQEMRSFEGWTVAHMMHQGSSGNELLKLGHVSCLGENASQNRVLVVFSNGKSQTTPRK